MNMEDRLQGLVFSVSRASGEDGPGIRTTVFLEGCPLRCVWCHSPQSQGEAVQRLSFYANRCIGCHACLAACPTRVHEVVDGRRVLSWEKCRTCGACVDACPSGALEMVGRPMTVEEVVDEVSRDMLFYRSSGGGVTFSGGEPTAQPEFVRACAGRCRELGIHTALDTCGYAQRQVFEELLPVFDLVLYDIKHMDSQRHRQLTGVGNDLVLENLRYVDAVGVPVWIRVPLIPGCNDGQDNIEGLADLLKSLRCVERVSLLSYNTAAGARYPVIGKRFNLEVPELSADREQQIVESLAKTGVEVELRR